jgi:hypothetical protein
MIGAALDLDCMPPLSGARGEVGQIIPR